MTSHKFVFVILFVNEYHNICNKIIENTCTVIFCFSFGFNKGEVNPFDKHGIQLNFFGFNVLELAS